MDGTGQEQDMGHPTGHPLPDNARIDGVPETLQHKKQVVGSDDTSDVGGGKLATDDGANAVKNQSVVSPDAYAGSSESGV